jgi:methyl-accepting chemotaxis protein
LIIFKKGISNVLDVKPHSVVGIFMGTFKVKTMRSQISTAAGSSLIIAVTACILSGMMFSHELFKLNRARSTALFQHEVASSLSSKLQVRADGIEQVIIQALGVAKGLGDSMQSLIDSGAINRLNREDINQLVYSALKNNPKDLAAYIVWEPNTVDGKDADYAGEGKHTTDDGQFGPYWTRSQNNELQVRPIDNKKLYSEEKDAQGMRLNEWYLCSRDKKSPCVVDPAVWNVQGVPTLMSSIVYPVIVNERFVGMSGVDISMAFLKKLLEDLDSNLYRGAGDLRIISFHGFLVGSTYSQERVGKPLDRSEWTLLQPQLQSAKGSVIQQGDDFVIKVPITLSAFGTPWLLEYRVPISIALASMFEFNDELDGRFVQSLYWQIAIGALVALVGAFILFVVAGRLAKPLQQLTKLVDGLAQSDGDITKRIGLKRHDEIGRLADALDLFWIKHIR